jgi:hypothetical protein
MRTTILVGRSFRNLNQSVAVIGQRGNDPGGEIPLRPAGPANPSEDA